MCMYPCMYIETPSHVTHLKIPCGHDQGIFFLSLKLPVSCI